MYICLSLVYWNICLHMEKKEHLVWWNQMKIWGSDRIWVKGKQFPVAATTVLQGFFWIPQFLGTPTRPRKIFSDKGYGRLHWSVTAGQRYIFFFSGIQVSFHSLYTTWSTSPYRHSWCKVDIVQSPVILPDAATRPYWWWETPAATRQHLSAEGHYQWAGRDSYEKK